MKYLLFFILLFEFTLSSAQYKEPRYGDIDTIELKMSRYAKDSTAAALILFDYGKLSFNINQNNRFQNEFVKHCRLKIFNKSALHLADYAISLMQNPMEREELSNLKAATYNLIDGKIVKTDLDSTNIFTDSSKYMKIWKIAFPEVKEGSIIEYSYKITSEPPYNLRGWEFQYPYPAVWSQYIYCVPENLNFRKISKGFLRFDINIFERSTRIYTVHYNYSIYIGNKRTSYSAQNIELNTIEAALAIADIPAFIPEPNIDCAENYLSSIQFELMSVRNPDQSVTEYTQSWKSVNKFLNEEEYFGKLLKAKRFKYDDDLLSILKINAPEKEKAVAIYNYIQNRMKWDEQYNILTFRGLKKPYSERIGNSAEINLLLTLLLQNAGLKANPVIIRTRDHGLIDTSYSSVKSFNSVISRVEIDSNFYLLDATNKYCPFALLPPYDINGKGRVVNDLNGEWTDLETKAKFTLVKNYILKIGIDGKFTGSIIESYDSYGAFEYRSSMSLLKSQNDYFRKKEENLKGLVIKSHSNSDIKDNDKPITDTLQVEISDHADLIGDKIIFNPMLFEGVEKNIYTLEERKYPVNYNYLFSEMYFFEYTIPPGYEVESLPQSGILKLPDNSILITYNIQKNADKIKMAYKLNINKITFKPDEYPALKEIYNQMIKLHSEMVILKKQL